MGYNACIEGWGVDVNLLSYPRMTRIAKLTFQKPTVDGVFVACLGRNTFLTSYVF